VAVVLCAFPATIRPTSQIAEGLAPNAGHVRLREVEPAAFVNSCQHSGTIALYRGRKLGRPTLTQGMLAESFTGFVEEAGQRIQHALVAAFGREVGVDAAAEAMAYGWEHWDRIHAMKNPAGYVYVVGRDRARSMKRPRVVVNAAPESGGSPWVEPGLVGALGELSERQRVAVVLVHGGEWTISEVAVLLDISRGSVKRHLERGTANLRRRLEGGK